MIKVRIKNWSQRPKFDVGDILKLFGCKMSARKLLKLNGTPESLPTAWGLKSGNFETPLNGVYFSWFFEYNTMT